MLSHATAQNYTNNINMIIKILEVIGHHPRRSIRQIRPLLRTTFLFFCFYLLTAIPPAPATGEQIFVFNGIVDQARKLAEAPFMNHRVQVPDFLKNIDYDDWREIRFIPEMALWRKEKLNFTVQFFHPGFYYDHSVAINIVEDQGVHRIPFSPEMFDYGHNTFADKIPSELGYAGFRVHYPINTRNYQDEVIVFLGATYLRAVAKNQNYGLSARAIAVDTAEPAGEEFPFFREFWIVKPKPDDQQITIYGLVDSRSLTAAYRFDVHPGTETLVDVTGRLFMRNKVQKLGLAPLTSMFFFGENTSRPPIGDYRPEIHDSDGLLVANGTGEWIWRPLINPPRLLVTSFQVQNPIGFGLIQRDLTFDHYQDLEANYHARPSLWIKPLGRWGKGRIELIQIPTENELNDNITAMWVPDAPSSKGNNGWITYQMCWHVPPDGRPPGGRVAATRLADGRTAGIKKFVIDFAGDRLEALPADSPLTAVISLDSRVQLVEQQLYKNRVTRGWRLVFQFRIDDPGAIERVLPPQKRNPYEMRAYLKLAKSALTETWSYVYFPDVDQ
jgi:glucans biosynthesis protein